MTDQASDHPYYKIGILFRPTGSEDNPDEYTRYFRLQSNHPFPSPVGTELFIPDDGGCELSFRVEVTKYEHANPCNKEFSKHPLGAFYMVVSTHKKSSGVYGVIPDRPDLICKYLLAMGWEEINS